MVSSVSRIAFVAKYAVALKDIALRGYWEQLALQPGDLHPYWRRLKPPAPLPLSTHTANVDSVEPLRNLRLRLPTLGDLHHRISLELIVVISPPLLRLLS